MTGSSQGDRYRAFTDMVWAFLEERLTPEWRAIAKRQTGMFADEDLGYYWHRALYERGWVAPNWPVEYGGPGWDPIERFLFHDACAKAGAPKIPTLGLQLCGPVIMRYGTPEQKNFYLPRILSREHAWCQGYSEPEAGSDLASLRTAAKRRGEEYVIEGSKIWTSNAHHANWIFVLARTDPTAKAQRGISFLLVPLDRPGITVRPIISMSGEHELNQVFFDDVVIPVANRVGPENEGWAIAKYLLEFERGASAVASRVAVLLRDARDIAGMADAHGRTLWSDSAAFRRKLAQVDLETQGLAIAERQVAARLAAGQPIGSMSSQLKLMGSKLYQDASELCLEALGPYATVDQSRALWGHPAADPVGPSDGAPVTARYLNSRAMTLYGGSWEIQHNILARTLGL